MRKARCCRETAGDGTGPDMSEARGGIPIPCDGGETLP
ncbi:hypothetical protein HMPREF1129_2636 [Actinomyces naeslundii str. Howell 279]|uniref:Uncharacterized protein n=1 Tax=Actinomyces naeslundii (strain ATCC 12104 / DSM 43013 / CCUG 2238 / JCM 8349 / NCTC 10301 / Howell 279) TaxID=1115803 RepID=J2ZPI6_ACTNH|nr:hypothetical protein HMPREF1129_2636 [Actinomyces naeslundii str. Howell 279]